MQLLSVDVRNPEQSEGEKRIRKAIKITQDIVSNTTMNDSEVLFMDVYADIYDTLESEEGVVKEKGDRGLSLVIGILIATAFFILGMLIGGWWMMKV